MGYPVDLFIEGNINQEFLCSICQDVLKDPTLVQPCEHAFCKTCIEQWHNVNNTCPIDRQEIYEFKKPPRIYMNLLNGLQMNCTFKSAGCNVVLALGDLTEHEERCEFNPEVKRDCTGGCGAVLNRVQQSFHNCVEHLKTELSSMKTDLEDAQSDLQMTKAELELKSFQLSVAKEKLHRYRCKLKQVAAQRPATATPSAAVAETAPPTSARARACPARYKLTTASASGVTLSLEDLRRDLISAPAAIASTSTGNATAPSTSAAAGRFRRRPCPARFKNTAPYVFLPRSPAPARGNVNSALDDLLEFLTRRPLSSPSTPTSAAPATPPARRSSRTTAGSCRPCPARFKK